MSNGHVVEDLQLADGSEFYLVRPQDTPIGSGLIFLHWFDEAPNADRTQYLEEAATLAASGVVSALPQLSFPWRAPPTDADSDLARIDEEAVRVLQVHDALMSVPGVDRSRVGLVGHDFGAMHGALLFGEVELAAAVLIAPTPRWPDWFLRFWPITGDRFDYMRQLSAVDPITRIPEADCPLLFQFGSHDFFIAPMTGLELFGAAPEPKTILTYETGHSMDEPGIKAERGSFLAESLGFASPPN
jgi:dienelactone hydrolase